MPKALKVKGLTIEVKGSFICQSLDLKLDKNQCLGILGSNGAGKTTLLNVLAGLPLDKKNVSKAGVVELFSQPIKSYSSLERAKKLGFLQQKNYFAFPATLAEIAKNSRYAHHLTRFFDIGMESISEASLSDMRVIDESLEICGLMDKKNQMVSSLSGGEVQRLLLAMLLAQQPDLYLLDEPFNNLDLSFHSFVYNQFGRKSQKTSIVVLHDLALVARMCSHLLLLKNGQWVFGSLDEVYQIEQMTWLYDTPMQAIKTNWGKYFLPQ